MGGVQKLGGSGCFPLSRRAGFRATEAVLISNTTVLELFFFLYFTQKAARETYFYVVSPGMSVVAAGASLPLHQAFTPVLAMATVARTERTEARVKASRLL